MDPLDLSPAVLALVAAQTVSPGDASATVITKYSLDRELDILKGTMLIPKTNLPAGWRDANPTKGYTDWIAEQFAEKTSWFELKQVQDDTVRRYRRVIQPGDPDQTQYPNYEDLTVTINGKTDKAYVDTQLATKGSQTDVVNLQNRSNYLMYRVNIPSINTNVVWLRSADLVGTLANGASVTTWSGPAGISNLLEATSGVAGTGTAPVFYSNERIPYVRLTGTFTNHGYLKFGNEAVTFPFANKDVFMLLVSRPIVQAMQCTVFGAAFELKLGELSQHGIGCSYYLTSQMSTLVRPHSTDPTYAWDGGNASANVVNKWGIVALRWSWANKRMTSLRWYSTTNSHVITDVSSGITENRNSVQFRLFGWLPALAGNGWNTNVSNTIDVAECQCVIADSISDEEMMTLWMNARQQYGFVL